jgi:phosphate ABC transporter phosphate-binding protein
MLWTLAAVAAQTIQLHGAGTTNPSKYFWKTMDLFEERAKVPLYMTYRAVGSSTGQFEFVGAANGNKPFNDFGAGDIPMTQSNWQAVQDSGGSVVQIPFVMGAIAIFHSVPGVDEANPIHLDGCTLAKVFSRQITEWSDPAIKALNPTLDVPEGTNINVVHRVHGSSSTAGTTEYLEKTCPEHWALGSGSTINWPSDTLDGQGSDGVASTIETVPYTIGYLDAGHGHALGFSEIALENADGNYLTSKQADIGAAGTQALAPPSVIPADPSADWSTVNLYDLAGPDTWPITMFSYFYVQKDLSAMDPQTAGLLKAFI